MIFRRTLALSLLIIIAIGTCQTVQATQSAQATAVYKVVRVYDGDTVVALGPAGKIKIRLVGIDAPETGKKKRSVGQPYSAQSKKYLTRMVLNRDIELVDCGKDRYGRTLGMIYVDNYSVNLAMVYYGLAEVYRGRPPKCVDKGMLINAETDAQQNTRGMWSLGDQYISPKAWRKMKSK